MSLEKTGVAPAATPMYPVGWLFSWVTAIWSPWAAVMVSFWTAAEYEKVAGTAR